MAVSPGNVRVGLTGAVSKAPSGAVAPTDAATALDAAYLDTGAISDAGVTLKLPGAPTKTVLKMWQNGANVRTLRTSADDSPQIQFVMLETNKTAVETYFGVTVTASVSTGTFDFVSGGIPAPKAYVLDVLDGAFHHRYYVPAGVKAGVGDLVYQNGAPVGYDVTLDCDLDPVTGINFRAWMTDLKTP